MEKRRETKSRIFGGEMRPFRVEFMTKNPPMEAKKKSDFVPERRAKVFSGWGGADFWG